MEEGGRPVPGAGAFPDRDVIATLVRRLPPGPLHVQDYRRPELAIFSDWDIGCHYAPFDHVEPAARVVLVGINPGVDQALAAYAAARDALWSGGSWDEAQRAAKHASVFRGPMLTNLVRMLDSIQLPARLGEAGICLVASSRELFEADARAVHATYCVRYPVAVNGRDYTGRRPRLLRSPQLSQFVFAVLEPELRLLPDAVVIPLGRVAGEAVAALVEMGALDVARCLFGVPHPSGANGHREEDFERARDELAAQLRIWFGQSGRPSRPARAASLESP